MTGTARLILLIHICKPRFQIAVYIATDDDGEPFFKEETRAARALEKSTKSLLKHLNEFNVLVKFGHLSLQRLESLQGDLARRDDDAKLLDYLTVSHFF